MNRNLAFYKKSGKPWTQEEYLNILTYVGDSGGFVDEDVKYIFDNGDADGFMFSWSSQKDHYNFENCKKVSYESVFCKPKIKLTLKD